MADKLHILTPALTQSLRTARLWRTQGNGRIQCELSPRRCRIPAGGLGFCGVRYNDGQTLKTLNYGKSVPMTRESIESEAVYHFAPGADILSLGNIGCMMQCDFCHNWQTSQARLARDADIVAYTPEAIVDYAVRHGIRILSWTYNDPVVWHEFVMDTARLARARGLLNLYKSAFYIGPQAVDELLSVIDIFSLSLKSMNPEHYRRFTGGGRLEPVLDAIRQVYAARGADGRGPHLELSNLCVTGRNDTIEESDKVARWMLEHLDADIPLHYVRFHPDYKYTGVARTDVRFLEQARASAKAMGLHHVYLGNVADTPSLDSVCVQCGATVVSRAGGMPRVMLRGDACPACGASQPIVRPFSQTRAVADDPAALAGLTRLQHRFRGPVQAVHVEQDAEHPLYFRFLDADGEPVGPVQHCDCRRFLLGRPGAAAIAVDVYAPPAALPRLYEVYDRAHFPVVAVTPGAQLSVDVPPARIDPR